MKGLKGRQKMVVDASVMEAVVVDVINKENAAREGG
jgi:hypothetical protein